MSDNILTIIVAMLGPILGFFVQFILEKWRRKIRYEDNIWENRIKLYNELLNFIQDYEVNKSENPDKTFSVPDEEIYMERYRLKTTMALYASKNVRDAFWKAHDNIKKGLRDRDYSTLAEIIRKELGLNAD